MNAEQLTAEQLTALLMAMKRKDIVAWAAANGIRLLHLQHYPKAVLVFDVVSEWARIERVRQPGQTVR